MLLEEYDFGLPCRKMGKQVPSCIRHRGLLLQESHKTTCRWFEHLRALELWSYLPWFWTTNRKPQNNQPLQPPNQITQKPNPPLLPHPLSLFPFRKKQKQTPNHPQPLSATMLSAFPAGGSAHGGLGVRPGGRGAQGLRRHRGAHQALQKTPDRGGPGVFERCCFGGVV